MTRTTVADWAQILGGIGTICGGVAITLRWMLRHLRSEIADIQAQLIPNGGSSLKDGVDRIEEELARQGSQLDALSNEFHRHLGFHEGQRTR